MFAISTAAIAPIAVPSESARPGSSVWTCTFSARRVADDEQRVAEPSARARARRRSSRRPRRRSSCSSGSGDSSWWIGRAPSRPAAAAPRRPLARREAGEAPRTISSSPAPPASTTPASRSTASSSGVRATAASPRPRTAAQQLGAGRPRRPRRPRPSRGSPSGSCPRPAGAPRGRRRRRGSGLRQRRLGVDRAGRRRARRTAPRTICDRITPELPRAPIRAPRATSARGRRAPSSGGSSRSASSTARTVSGEVRAGVAVGHRVDVLVVDPRAGRVEARGGPRGRARAGARGSVAHAACRTSWMWTATLATTSPQRRSTS